MRKPFLLIAGLAAGALLGESSLAERFTTHLDPIEGLLTTRVADTGLAPKVRKAFQGALRKLGKDTATLGKEIATARKVVSAIEKKAPADSELVAAAQTAADALAGEVSSFIDDVEADAAALPKKPAASVVVERFLTRARDRYTLSGSATTITSRLHFLGQAMSNANSARRTVDRATGGGGGGGACGPDPRPAGIRAVAAGESLDLTFDAQTFPNGFSTESLTANVGNLNVAGPSFPTLPKVLQVKAFDCTRHSVFTIQLPYPPVVNTTYRSGQAPDNGTGIATQSDWDGFTQGFPGTGTSVTVTAFDEASKEITFTWAQSFTTIGGTIVLEDWRVQ